jgi:hypothetical protein
MTNDSATLSLATRIDNVYRMRKDRYELNRRVKEMEDAENMLKAEIVDELYAIGISGASGMSAKFELLKREIPIIQDYEAFSKYVLDKGHLELLQRRLSEFVVREFWGNGVEIPGVSKIEVDNVSITKREA